MTDDQAWPAQLERALNERSATKFEVWNFGTPAYVPSQMVVIAEEAIERLRPDLVIFALSNKGTRAFLQDDDLRRHFGGNSANWAYFLTPDVLTWPEELPYETNLALVKASALYRLGVLYQLLDQEERRIVHQPAHEQANVDATHRFLREAVGRTRVMIFVPPSSTREEFGEYYDDNTPLMVLNADDKPAEYRDVHGPAPVMAWYGDRIADWLFAQDWFKIATANEAPTERNE
ncbi:hypothetical protein KDL45_10025 [bacterium]|nr:hypothetical protein [bacterium]